MIGDQLKKFLADGIDLFALLSEVKEELNTNRITIVDPLRTFDRLEEVLLNDLLRRTKREREKDSLLDRHWNTSVVIVRSSCSE